MKTNKKTITLGRDEPSTIVCRGHVLAPEFNKAFKNEGWSDAGSYTNKELAHVWGKKLKTRIRFSALKKPGLQPYTVTSWDSGRLHFNGDKMFCPGGN